MSILKHKDAGEAVNTKTSSKSAVRTVGGKSNQAVTNREHADEYNNRKHTSKSHLIPLPVGMFLVSTAAKNSITNFKVNYYRNKMDDLHEKARLDHQAQSGDAIGSRYAAIMNQYAEADIKKKLRRVQKKQERNRVFGAMMMQGLRNVGQMASIRTRRNAMNSGLRGRSDGMDRSEIATMNEVFADDMEMTS